MLQSNGKRVGLLIYSQALEHMADPRLELEKAKQLIDGETLLFIGVPGLRNLGPHYAYDFLNYLQPGHLIHFERLTLSRLRRLTREPRGTPAATPITSRRRQGRSRE